MKIKTIILSIAALLLCSLTGCQYEEPAPYKPVVMFPNMTIMQFKTLYTSGPLVITRSDIVLGGKIISTDQYGNFYRSFFIQDLEPNGGGIEIKTGLTGMYNDYKIGQLVFVNPYDLCLGMYGGLHNLGYRSLNPKYETAYIDIPAIIKGAVFRGAQTTPVDPVDIKNEADITAHNGARFGTWVRLRNAEYRGGAGGLTTWAFPPNPALDETANYGEQNFRLSDGTNIVVRTSGYAKFAGTTIPFTVGQKVDITGVLTKYNSVFQLVLNNDTDAVAAQ